MIPLKSSDPTLNSLRSSQSPCSEKQLFFEQGIAGYPHHKVFNFFSLSERGLDPLQMIVSIDNFPLSLVIINQQEVNLDLIKRQNQQNITEEFSFLKEEYNIFYVVTFHKPSSSLQLTINTRAPLIIADQIGSPYMLAWQYIHPSSAMDTKYFLEEISKKIETQMKKLRINK